MFRSHNIVKGVFLLTIFFLFACATYYQKRISFQRDFAGGEIDQAKKFLLKEEKKVPTKDQLLYYLDRGVVEQMLGNYDSSNVYLEKAYIYSQDFRKQFTNDIVGMVANPMLKPYKGEDFEIVLIHYYKAINYIQLGSYNEALVEIRRINIRLNEQSDKYEGKKYRYKEDAFAHLLMGTVYEAQGNINDAFIAYRNAYETYQTVYNEFGVSAPQQLKSDLLRTAKQIGFNEELRRYEEEFGMQASAVPDSSESLVFFWLNGLVPVKGEISLNLNTTKGGSGGFVFADDQQGISIPFTFSSPDQASKVSDLSFVRLAIPKYNRRDPLITQSHLMVDGKRYQLEEAEDISEIAIANLEDRILKELASSIGRLAVKQAAEEAARQQNENLGVAVSFLNALTEKADTRNWQTLPHSIHYQRIFLKPGNHSLRLVNSYKNGATDTTKINVQMAPDKTTFKTFHSLASSMVQ